MVTACWISPSSPTRRRPLPRWIRPGRGCWPPLSDDWDDQLEGFESGWPAFFDVLRLYLEHFAGQRSASFVAMTSIDGDHLAVWKRMTRELQLAGADAGEQRTTPGEPERLSGVIERIHQNAKQRFILMRLEAPAPGVALVGTYLAGERVNASMSMYFYDDNAEVHATASQHKWRGWLSERFGLQGQ